MVPDSVSFVTEKAPPSNKGASAYGTFTMRLPHKASGNPQPVPPHAHTNPYAHPNAHCNTYTFTTALTLTLTLTIKAMCCSATLMQTTSSWKGEHISRHMTLCSLFTRLTSDHRQRKIHSAGAQATRSQTQQDLHPGSDPQGAAERGSHSQPRSKHLDL